MRQGARRSQRRTAAAARLARWTSSTCVQSATTCPSTWRKRRENEREGGVSECGNAKRACVARNTVPGACPRPRPSHQQEGRDIRVKSCQVPVRVEVDAVQQRRVAVRRVRGATGALHEPEAVVLVHDQGLRVRIVLARNQAPGVGAAVEDRLLHRREAGEPRVRDVGDVLVGQAHVDLRVRLHLGRALHRVAAAPRAVNNVAAPEVVNEEAADRRVVEPVRPADVALDDPISELRAVAPVPQILTTGHGAAVAVADAGAVGVRVRRRRHGGALCWVCSGWARVYGKGPLLLRNNACRAPRLVLRL